MFLLAKAFFHKAFEFVKHIVQASVCSSFEGNFMHKIYQFTPEISKVASLSNNFHIILR